MKIKKINSYKYQLLEKFTEFLPIYTGFRVKTDFVTLNDNILTLRGGYAWDGASGPTIDTRDCIKASAVHDALYQLIKLGLLPEQFRKMADCVFYDLLLKNGMDKVRAYIWYKSVRAFGGMWLKKGKEPEVFEV